ncbi:MAG: hypothetical protein M5R36_05015 [Deltaproteobacteria bacterium]|nr:hypothetical protein [Deltaproteobacteria bacterium]
MADALPIPPLTSGITAAPAVAYDGGGTIIGTGAFAYPPMLVDVRDGTVTAKALSADLSVNISGHGAFGYMEPGGPLHYALPTMSGIKIVEGWVSILRPLLMSWDLTDRKAGPAAKAELEDIHFYVSPAIADVDGDGRSEVIAGSSGFYVHALSPDGTEPPGWPKYTFNWIIASVAAGDPDNDGLLEIIQPTHEGRLLGWEATGPACTVDRLNATWRRFHHDERNTGYLGTDTLPPGVPLDFTKSPAGDGGTILNWDAPGGDWYCGRAARYEIRVGDDPDALRTPEGFAEAEVIDADLTPRAPRRAEELALPTQPFERHFAIRAVDAEGHLGHIALAEEDFGTCCDDDDTADDDDDFSDDDDDDDDACCGC